MSAQQDYWQVCISIAAEECELKLTPEQLAYLAEAVEGGHEHYGMAFYTCSASRHAAEIGETMARHGTCQMIADPVDAHEAGESIAATVAALWEARAEVARLKSNLAAIEDEKNAYIEYVGDALGQDHDGETLWDAAQRVLSERDRLRSICAAAYQLAGTVGAPQRFLDALSRGDGDVDTLLPISDDEIESLRDAARLDWLADPNNQIGNVQIPTDCVLAHPESMRAAIDMAMRMEGFEP